MRIVRRPDQTIVLDRSGKLAGRGAYLCADGSCWTGALKKRALERALSASLPSALREQLATADPTLIEGGIRGT